MVRLPAIPTMRGRVPGLPSSPLSLGGFIPSHPLERPPDLVVGVEAFDFFVEFALGLRTSLFDRL